MIHDILKFSESPITRSRACTYIYVCVCVCVHTHITHCDPLEAELRDAECLACARMVPRECLARFSFYFNLLHGILRAMHYQLISQWSRVDRHRANARETYHRRSRATIRSRNDGWRIPMYFKESRSTMTRVDEYAHINFDGTIRQNQLVDRFMPNIANEYLRYSWRSRCEWDAKYEQRADENNNEIKFWRILIGLENALIRRSLASYRIKAETRSRGRKRIWIRHDTGSVTHAPPWRHDRTVRDAYDDRRGCSFVV